MTVKTWLRKTAISMLMLMLDAPYSLTVLDINRTDILQMYAELNLGAVFAGNLKYRYGRQCLQYGSQRLLSTLGRATRIVTSKVTS